jgi:hypothetical protein
MTAPDMPRRRSLSHPSSSFDRVAERVDLARSGTLASVTYEASSSTLDVEFRKGGVYRYFMIPQALVRLLVEAESPGHVYVTQIRGRYSERRLD